MTRKTPEIDCSQWLDDVEAFAVLLATDCGTAEDMMWAARRTLDRREHAKVAKRKRLVTKIALLLRNLEAQKMEIEEQEMVTKRGRGIHYSDGKRKYLIKKIARLRKAGMSDWAIRNQLNIGHRELKLYGKDSE